MVRGNKAECDRRGFLGKGRRRSRGNGTILCSRIDFHIMVILYGDNVQGTSLGLLCRDLHGAHSLEHAIGSPVPYGGAGVQG